MTYHTSSLVKKVFLPEAKSIKWSRTDAWMGDYLLHGTDGMSVKNQVAMISAMKTKNITDDQLHYACVYRLIEMGYTFSALKEFFSRPEIIPKPDLLPVFRKCVVRLDPVGEAPLEERGPFFDFLVLFKEYAETPDGMLSIICTKPLISINVAGNIFSIHVAKAMKLIAPHALRRMKSPPTPKEVKADIKRLMARGDIIAKFEDYPQKVFIRLDWCLRHGVFPKNWTSHLRKRG